MKKFIISVAVLLASLSATVSCSFFQLDSFEGPNAEVTGNLIDMVTGEKMSIEAAQSQGFDWSTWSMVTTVSYGALTVYEQGYVPPTWGGAPEDYELKKGKNRMDIGVLPFCRVKDPKIEYNAATKKLVATFYVELGDPNRANKVTNVAFCGNTQLFVGANSMNLAKDHKPAKAQNVQPGELITLEIDTTAPDVADLFKYPTQDRYFRIGAMAEGNGYNSEKNKYYNFSPVYKMSADFSKIEEVQWDTVQSVHGTCRRQGDDVHRWRIHLVHRPSLFRPEVQ